MDCNDQAPMPMLKEKKLSKDANNQKSGESLGLISGASSMNKLDINRTIMRQKAGQSFKEFYKENLSALKYEIKQNQAKLLYWLSKKG